MKTGKLLVFTALLGAVFVLQSCSRSSNDVWEDTKSAGRHLQRSVSALSGNHGTSRQVASRADFEGIDDGEFYYQEQDMYDAGYSNGYATPPDFIPMQDQANQMGSRSFNSACEAPGEPGSAIPGIDFFRDPCTMPQLAGVFRTIYFDYDSSLIKGPQNLQTIHAIADYMRSHPNLYLFIEGHTDERGPQAYNLALGARRANTVRNLLVNEGVNPDHLFTISYGKERPVVLEHHEEGWARNRRAEFKVYVR